jgi:hypothetical protein
MLKCIDYEDTLFIEPQIFLMHGQFGKGYVVSPQNISVIKEVNIDSPAFKSWLEDRCIKLFSMDGDYLFEIPKHMPWNLIEGWCKAGAYIDFWYN